MKNTPAYIAKHIRTVIKNGGSAPHTEEVQRFFKHEVQSRGWYTDELRKVAVRFRRTIIAENGLPFLLQVADQLFRGEILEEKILPSYASGNRGGVRQGGVQVVRELARPRQHMGRSRRAGALPHRPHDRRRRSILVATASLGQGTQALASACRGRKSHPQRAAAQELRRLSSASPRCC